MKILLIEDDANKANNIQEEISKHYNAICIDKKESYQSGLKAIINNADYDLLLLDMSIPTHDKSIGTQSEVRPMGGIDILKELKRRSISINVIVITQFDDFIGKGEHKRTLNELKQEMSTLYENYKKTISYVQNETAWRNELINNIKIYYNV